MRRKSVKKNSPALGLLLIDWSAVGFEPEWLAPPRFDWHLGNAVAHPRYRAATSVLRAQHANGSSVRDSRDEIHDRSIGIFDDTPVIYILGRVDLAGILSERSDLIDWQR